MSATLAPPQPAAGAAALTLDMPLTDKERDQLARCEAVIAEGKVTFLKVGTALFTIRNQRLYRATHGTWDAYLRDKHDLGTAYAHRLIEAAEVVQNLIEPPAPEDSPIVNAGGDIEAAATPYVLPANEAQARELSHLTPDQQRAVWAKVTEENFPEDITAAKVAATAEALFPKPAPAPKAEPAVDGQTSIYDVQDVVDAGLTGPTAGDDKPAAAAPVDADTSGAAVPKGAINKTADSTATALTGKPKPAVLATQNTTVPGKPGALKTAEEIVAEKAAAAGAEPDQKQEGVTVLVPHDLDDEIFEAGFDSPLVALRAIPELKKQADLSLLFTPLAQKALAACVERWNADYPDNQLTKSAYLETVLIGRVGAYGITADALKEMPDA